MLDLEKLFSPAELEEWKDTLITWEATGYIENPESYEEWEDELPVVFEAELKGKTLDEETVQHWRKKLDPETRKARKAYLREQEKERKARERFVELRTQGLGYENISQELGVSKSKLLEWQAGLEKELAEARYLRLDGLAEQYGAKRESRVETYGDLLRRLREELGKRDLSDIPTDKLLNLSMTVQEKLQKELSPVKTVIHKEGALGESDYGPRQYAEID